MKTIKKPGVISRPGRKTAGGDAGAGGEGGKGAAGDPNKTMSKEDLLGAINAACKTALADVVGLTDTKIQAAVQSAFEAQSKKAGDKPLKKEDLDTILQDAVKGLKPDIEALKAAGEPSKEAGKGAAAAQAAAVAAVAVGDDNQPLTVKGAMAMFTDLLAKVKTASRKQFDTDGGDSSIYIEDGDRAGNLTVGRKQLLNVALGKAMNDGIQSGQLQSATRKGLYALERLGNQVYAGGYKALSIGAKMMSTETSGSGAEWVPSDLSTTLYRRMYMASPLAQWFLAREIEMPTDNYQYPLRTTKPKFYGRNPGQAAIASQSGSGKFTLIAQKLMGMVEMEYEIEEDSIVPILPVLEADLGTAAAEAWESSILNGDMTNPHMDSDIQAITGASEKSYKGIRKRCLDANLKVDFSTGGIIKANLKALRKKIGLYGINPRDLAWVAGVNGYNEFINLDEVFTMDKFGQRATVQTGELFFYKGIQIMVAGGVREDLNASGVYDGTTTTKGALYLIYLPFFLTGRRRDFTLETDKDVKNQTRWLVASFRKAFEAQEEFSINDKITPAAIGYNWAV